MVKAIACELPAETGIPLSRWSRREITRHAIQRGIVATVSDSTVWRWLNEDAIRPWHHRAWIFPRDALFAQRAGPVLDLYQGLWQGHPLLADDCVLSTDEKTSIQARIRCHPTAPPSAGRDMRVEQVMAQEPYRSAKRVFWIMGNGSSHRGAASVRRFRETWPTIVPVHLPIHASWLNQVEIYFSIIQRKVLTPNDFPSLEAVEDRLLQFQAHYEKTAAPFEWKFTRDDLCRLLEKLNRPDSLARVA